MVDEFYLFDMILKNYAISFIFPTPYCNTFITQFGTAQFNFFLIIAGAEECVIIWGGGTSKNLRFDQ